MITGFYAAAGRHRRAILVVGLVLSTGYLLGHVRAPWLGQRAFPAMSAATLVFLLLAVVAIAQARPTAFVMQPRVPAFSAPSQPYLLFLTLSFLTIATGMAGNVIRDWGSEPFLPDQLIQLGHPVMVSLLVVLVWRDTSVQLRPEGLWRRGITGWLIVPWNASPTVPTLPPPPNAKTVTLHYGRPELVRRHGLHLHRRRVRTDAIDPRFLCAAIQYYMAHPLHRPAIGTQPEYERVLPHLLNSLDWSPPHLGIAEHHHRGPERQQTPRPGQA